MALPSEAGDSATLMPADFMASILSPAPPLPPEMIAPAWPMRRAGAGDDGDLALPVDVARHDADLALFRRDNAGAVRADETGAGIRQRALHAQHVQDRNALGDADHQRDLGIDRFQDRIGRERRRD